MIKKSFRILIVDDDLDSLSNLADILSDVGYEIVTACDGEIALKEFSSDEPAGDASRFDLCLLDFKMPGMDGVELLEKIHAEHPRLRAIMITAYAGDDGVQRALDAGTWKVLRKPVDIDSLLELIDEAIPSWWEQPIGPRAVKREVTNRTGDFNSIIDYPPAPKLDALNRLIPTKATKAELRWEALFHGKAKCPQCHSGPAFVDDYMPLPWNVFL